MIPAGLTFGEVDLIWSLLASNEIKMKILKWIKSL
jgi:hypothetical protein